MRELNILAVSIVIGLMFLLFASDTQKEIEFTNENQTSHSGIPQITLNLSSDKEVYHSSEEMELRTAIETPSKVENLTIKVYGIKDRSGRFRVNGERIVNIDPPGINETFAFHMPSCYGCAGVSPGDYEIIFEVIRNDEIIGNHSLTVKLEG